MRNFIIPCQDCDLEFDGTLDGPKAYVYFCPLHRGAKELEIFVSALVNAGALDSLPNVKRMAQDMLGIISPIAPVGAPSRGPVASGASLQEGSEKQTPIQDPSLRLG